MKIIFGLGNPGLRYAATRHNCGFLTLDKLAYELRAEFGKKEHDCQLAAASCGGSRLLLAKPQSYMNLSGFPVVRLCAYYKVPYEQILVICDDMSLPPGMLRMRRGGSDGGHNGLKSIIEQTATAEFNRLRIGIGHALFDTPSYVTSHFAPEEALRMAKAINLAAEAALCWAEEGIESAMNRYNNKQAEEE